MGVIGGTGTVGQKLLENCINNPWFEITAVAASKRSAGKPYQEAVEDRWALDSAIPKEIANVIVDDAQDIDEIAKKCDIVFSATKLSKPEVEELEESYAKAGLWVSSSSSAQRGNMLVPTLNPGVNDEHLELIPIQRRRMGYETGANIVKSNCAVVPGLAVMSPFLKDPETVVTHTHFTVIQALSGMPATRNSFPEIIDNLIPLDGERRKTEQEPSKILGRVTEEGIVLLTEEEAFITAQNLRADVANGHMAIVNAIFQDAPSEEEVLQAWSEFGSPLQKLPTAPKNMIEYTDDPSRPQILLDHPAGNGLAIVAGQLRIRRNVLTCIASSDNTQIGAAGGSVLATEMAIKKGLIFRRI